MRQWKLHYAVFEDGGRTRVVAEQIICVGQEFDAVHPLPRVIIGTNCVMIGDLGQLPLTRSDGAILMPVQSTPIGPDGKYYNPGAGYTYTDCLLLVGHWSEDGRLCWSCSEWVCGDPERTTRGLVEPTIAELADGRLMMVMRGSNDADNELPSHKWRALSADGGQNWGAVEPWTYSDGEAFFSPSACSQLIPWVDGRLLWAGNICAANPSGNRPRYPLVVGEVDRENGLLIRVSVQTVDDRQADDDALSGRPFTVPAADALIFDAGGRSIGQVPWVRPPICNARRSYGIRRNHRRGSALIGFARHRFVNP